MDTKALRQKILDLAIRGKLIPQDPNDEPASVLLERVRAEKQQMVKDGRLKAKDVKNDTVIFVGEDNLHYEKFADGTVKCIEDEIPFDVPEGWEWCRCRNIVDLFSGQDLEPQRYNSNGVGIPYITGASNLSGGHVIINRWTETPTTYATINDLLLTCKGSGVGKMAICDIEDAHIARQIMALRCTSAICLSYLQVLMSAFITEITYQANGIIPGIRREIVLETLFPLPPYNEQIQIGDRCSALTDLVLSVDMDQAEMLSLVGNIKAKILDLAIRGKLVPQNPNDEPASILLDRIRAEKEELIKQGKIKRDRRESVIFRGEDNSYYEKIGGEIRCIDSEIPFDIPDSWTFVRLKHIGEIIGGGTPKTNNPDFWDGSIAWITPADLSGYESMFISTGSRNITEAGLKGSSAQLMPAGSVLYSSRAPIGYVAIASNPIATNQGFKSIVPYIADMNQYLYFCLKARTDTIIQRATGTTFKEISGSQMAKTIIPLPPLTEQIHIAQMIISIRNVITSIENSLT